jgi:putative transposase
MKINGIKPVRTRKHKITTNGNHSLGMVANTPNRKWASDKAGQQGCYLWLHQPVLQRPKAPLNIWPV